jgi:hypothetical protein
VPHQPPTGLPHALPIRSQRRGNNVLVALDRDVNIVEGVDKVTWLRVRLLEVPVEDDSGIGSVKSSIPHPPG